MNRRAAATCRFLLQWCGRLALVAVVSAVVLAVLTLFVAPRLVGGGAALTVLTGSMTPDIPVGSVVVIRPVDPGTLQVGDVATYQVSPEQDAYITHRIVSVDDSTSPTTFVFKGDANRGADTEPVPADAVRGEVVFHVPYLGSARDLVQSSGGTAGLMVLLLGAYAVAQFVAAARDRSSRVRTVPRTHTLEDGAVLVRLSRIEATVLAEAVSAVDPDAEVVVFAGPVTIESAEAPRTVGIGDDHRAPA